MTTAESGRRRNRAKAETAARAMFDVMGAQRDGAGRLVDKIPPERFGKARARFTHKLVLLAIACSADPDGRNAFPSRETIGHRCLMTARAVDLHIKWLSENGLLRVERKAGRPSKLGRTNRYTILFGDGQEASTGWEGPEPEEAEAPAAQPSEGVNQAPGTNEPARGTTGTTTENNGRQHGEQCGAAPGSLTTPDRPLDRPNDRPLDPRIAPIGYGVGDPRFHTLMDKLLTISGYDIIFDHRAEEAFAKIIRGCQERDVVLAYTRFYDQLDDYSRKFALKNWLEKAPGFLRAAVLERQQKGTGETKEEARKRQEEQLAKMGFVTLDTGGCCPRSEAVKCEDGQWRRKQDCIQGPDGIWRDKDAAGEHGESEPCKREGELAAVPPVALADDSVANCAGVVSATGPETGPVYDPKSAQFRELMAKLYEISGTDMVFAPSEEEQIARLVRGFEQTDIIAAYKLFYLERSKYPSRLKTAAYNWLLQAPAHIRAFVRKRQTGQTLEMQEHEVMLFLEQADASANEKDRGLEADTM